MIRFSGVYRTFQSFERRLVFLLVACGLFVAALLLGCERSSQGISPGPPFEGRLGLQAEPGVVEAWLTVRAESLPPDAQNLEVVLTRDGAERLRFPAIPETTVVDTGLLPAHSYTYAARLEKDGHTAARSNSVELTTLDTTSHNFQWEIIKFPSPHGSGYLLDVAIINENDIWAVGAIYRDSGHPPLPYNAVHWDGQQWELMRIQFRYFCDRDDTFPAPIKSVVAFGPDEVFFTAISQITYWNGQTQEYIECIPVSVNKLWGTNRNNIYAVGALGKIAHYDGQRWTRIESGTELDIQDIWGAAHPSTGEWEILAVASDYLTNHGTAVLRLRGYLVETLPNQGLPANLSGIWASSPRRWYISGGGVYRSGWGEWDWRAAGDLNWLGYLEGIRGNGENDLFVVGHFGAVLHWNGQSWHRYQELPDDRIYYGVSVKGDLVVAVGVRVEGIVGAGPVLLRGERN